MKFGHHLKENVAPEYGPEAYLNYSNLDGLIRVLNSKSLSSVDEANRQVSLSTPPPTNAKGIPLSSKTITEEDFCSMMDSELTKVETFTLSKVTELRTQLHAIENKISLTDLVDELDVHEASKLTDKVAEDFLTLEKYVNINFMGFHKILKKHDKYCPTNPCKTFYVNRMHNQAWVRGDYSDVVVRLSVIYASLRNDQVNEEISDLSQSFLRSTTKYWIKTEDVSRVKYQILRNLPIFLQKANTGESDSQLTNSVYLDNDQLELYHGRLDKTPGALALRLRWYGSGDPSIVFVERKTHREQWMGEVSVKERFMIKEKEVQQVLNGNYSLSAKKRKMLEKGTSQQEADDWECLVREIIQVVGSKQLVPTIRTQYMRTAFQIPFDATVRVSLDTNLCMISERGYGLKNNKVWHRDPKLMIEHNQITRFPHAVLEVKLELKGENTTPPKWVTALQNSGMLYEVHKFSKFIHGCAVIHPEDVMSVPYWVDDVSLRKSIINSGGARILANDEGSNEKSKAGVGPGANQIYDHLLPFGHIANDKRDTAHGRTAESKLASEGILQGNHSSTRRNGNYGINFYNDADVEDEEAFEDLESSCCFPFCTPEYNLSVVAPTSIQKIEPKVFFANERTFLHWLHAGVTLYTISAGILVFSTEADASWVHLYAMALLPIALGFCMYALRIFLWRADRIKSRIPGRWDDPRGPMILGGFLALVLTASFISKVYEIWSYEDMEL